MVEIKEMDGKMYYWGYNPIGGWDNEGDFDWIEIKNEKTLLLLKNREDGKEKRIS